MLFLTTILLKKDFNPCLQLFLFLYKKQAPSLPESIRFLQFFDSPFSHKNDIILFLVKSYLSATPSLREMFAPLVASLVCQSLVLRLMDPLQSARFRCSSRIIRDNSKITDSFSCCSIKNSIQAVV